MHLPSESERFRVFVLSAGILSRVIFGTMYGVDIDEDGDDGDGQGISHGKEGYRDERDRFGRGRKGWQNG